MAIRQSASILAAGSAGSVSRTVLLPGSQWRADRLLLSVGRESVKYLAGNVLYEQDLVSFLDREFFGLPLSAGKAPWLAGLSRYEMPFCMSLASTLALACEESVSGCSFFERFSCYYCNHRTDVELAARHLYHVLDGLFAMQQQPALFALCMDSMGERARSSLPKGVAPPDIASFLGRLLIGAGRDRITLADLPSTVRSLRESATEEAGQYLRIPHFRRMLDTLERFAETAATLLDRLRAAW